MKKSNFHVWKFDFQTWKMEDRKEIEIAHYDTLAKKQQGSDSVADADTEGLSHGIFSSYAFVEKLLAKYVREGTKLLDYGCGNGVHSIFPAKKGAEVIGIDLSEASLELARKRAERERIGDRITFLKMDCEIMTFADNSFDVIFDGGTFSSLDVGKAFPELARVLKPNGKLIGIETFGYNPLGNIKRALNKKRGIRTEWAAEHIMTNRELELAKQYFDSVEIHYFHLIPWGATPVSKLPVARGIIKLLDFIDSLVLFCLPFLRTYAFKIVFVFSKPKK